MIDFSKVEQSVDKLNNQVSAGDIDQNIFKANLLELIDFAADGYYWMFGHNSKQWYRHNGRQWVVDDPDRLQTLTPSQNDDKVDPAPPPVGENIILEWRSVNWTWFIISLITLSTLAWVIYSSSLL